MYRLLCRAEFGVIGLPACKYSQENGVGPMVYWAAVPVCPCCWLYNLVQGLEAGGRVGGPVDCLSQDVEGETLPRWEELQASRPVSHCPGWV